MTVHDEPSPAVLARWGLPEDAPVARVDVGLINLTLFVDRGDERLVLQRLHPIFGPEVHLDIAAITARLAARGVSVPRLVPTTEGALWAEVDGAVWRAMTFLPGRTVPAVASEAMARSAAALVAGFHAALSGFAHEFHFVRAGVHDTPRHLAHLREAVEAHPDHRLAMEVRAVAEGIFSEAASLPSLEGLPRRIVHGDLKITNLLFAPEGDEAVALLDLDTLAHGTLATELGDALRSWCNRTSESDPQAVFDAGLFAAAVAGYADAARDVGEEERRALVPGVRTIALELASRFCADALEERYFGWDAARYATRGEHCLVRARSQLSLARSVAAQADALEAAVAEAFGVGRLRGP